MKFIVCVFLFAAQVLCASTLYEGNDFALTLYEDSTYIMYPVEESLPLRFAGTYVNRKDSVILTSHRYDNEVIVLGIYAVGKYNLALLYVQPTWEAYLPGNLFIQKRFYPGGTIKEDYIWDDYSSESFQLYRFSPERWIRSITNFAQGNKQGKEFIFFTNSFDVIAEERNYDKGLLSGKAFTYEPIDEKYAQVQIAQIAVYKDGELKKIKRPATPPVFYTSHF